MTFTGSLTLTSTAGLPVTMVLELDQPFMVLEDEMRRNVTTLKLDAMESVMIELGFQPPVQHNLKSRVFNEILKISYIEHPQKVINWTLTCHFINSSLLQ